MELREKNVHLLADTTHDVLIVGGGINGAVSAACLSARGAKVALIDRGDFAGKTSQESSNLAWGGIKYLESFEFGLVRKLCVSRNHLLQSYPSTVQEIRFYTTHKVSFRHGLWKLLFGALLYWLLGSFAGRPPRLLTRARMAREEPIIDLTGVDGGFEYSDAYLHDNDARFVFCFVRAALDSGCVAANYVESTEARRAEDGVWVVKARDGATGRELTVRARVLINACGPFVDEHNALSGERTRHRHVFSKGIHLIVDKLTQSRRVLTFFADDGRLFFVIPMGPRTCIGTTDTRVEAPSAEVTPEDRRFVLDNINKRLRLPRPLTEADIIAERCGVRPLVVTGGKDGEIDWLQLSRKHAVEVDHDRAHVSIFGGKLTDCLNVGQEVAAAVQKLGVSLPHPRRRWYGEPAPALREEFFEKARRMDLDGLTSESSSEKLSTRLWRRYGASAFAMLDAILEDRRMANVLIEGAEYLRCEIEYAARSEMVEKLEDFLRRRSKISLVIREGDLLKAPGLQEACRILFGEAWKAKLDEYVADRQRAEGSPASLDASTP